MNTTLSLNNTVSTQHEFTTQFNRFSVILTEAAVKDCSHSDDCDNDCKFWQKKLHKELKEISDADLRAELKETGAWGTSELMNRKTNEERIIWIAANNIAEELK